MPISSYIAYPVEGHRDALMNDLSQNEHCEVMPSENTDVFILMTDTSNWEEEQALHGFLSEQEGLLCLALTYAQVEEQGPKIELPSRLTEAKVGVPHLPEGDV